MTSTFPPQFHIRITVIAVDDFPNILLFHCVMVADLLMDIHLIDQSIHHVSSWQILADENT